LTHSRLLARARAQVVMAYTVGIAASLATMQLIPASAAALQWANVFMIGFFLYGPQMLIGLCGAELVGPDSVGASEGFLGWIAYLGARAAAAGAPRACGRPCVCGACLRARAPHLAATVRGHRGSAVRAGRQCCQPGPPPPLPPFSLASTPSHTPCQPCAHTRTTAGAANAGIPLSIIVKEYGWATYFNTLIGACALALLLLSPMVNLKSFVQRRELWLARRAGGGAAQ
jgi:hypothetical protein